MKNFIQKNKTFVIISVCFFVLYCLLSLGNHHGFRTDAWDLGIFNQAIYQYSHLKFAPNTIMHRPNMLADHFEIVMILVAPFYYIFGSYTLLIFQILMVIFGALGIFLYLKEKIKDDCFPLGGVLIFYCFYGLFASLIYDFHNNITGIMFLPWILLMLEKNNKKWFYAFLVLMILSKENFCMTAFFLGIYITLFEKKWRLHGIITMIIGFTSLEIIIGLLIPYFNHGSYTHWVYGQIGPTPLIAIKNILKNPLWAFKILFNDPIKLDSWGALFITGGGFAFANPLGALLMTPILAEKYFSSERNHWSYYFQYTVEFAPLVAICIPLTLSKIKFKLNYFVLVTFIVMNIFLSTTVFYNNYKKISDIFNKKFYFEQRIADSQMAVEKIPPGTSVSASNSLVSHLADRDQIYQFPEVNNAEFVVLDYKTQPNFPFSNKQEFEDSVNKFKQTNRYSLYYQIGDIEIYHSR